MCAFWISIDIKCFDIIALPIELRFCMLSNWHNAPSNPSLQKHFGMPLLNSQSPPFPHCNSPFRQRELLPSYKNKVVYHEKYSRHYKILKHLSLIFTHTSLDFHQRCFRNHCNHHKVSCPEYTTNNSDNESEHNLVGILR